MIYPMSANAHIRQEDDGTWTVTVSGEPDIAGQGADPESALTQALTAAIARLLGVGVPPGDKRRLLLAVSEALAAYEDMLDALAADATDSEPDIPWDNVKAEYGL